MGTGMSATLERRDPPALAGHSVALEAFGELEAISRPGGQGRVHRPNEAPPELGPGPIVVKLYRRQPPADAALVLSEMAAWGDLLDPDERARLRAHAAWPLAVVTAGRAAVGIAMEDVGTRFSAPFLMPSGKRERVLLALEHLLGADDYLQLRGLDVRLDTTMRARVAERVSAALAFLHRRAIVVSDLAPSNLLVAFAGGWPEVCFIDCDSMVFRGRQALTSVETGDWNIPGGFGEPPGTRAADAYKLGLVVLRLFARSHDARAAGAHLRYVPVEVRDLLYRSLDADAVDRPPAGEWQRALGELLARGGLNERFPGPVPRRRGPLRRRRCDRPDPSRHGVRLPAPRPRRRAATGCAGRSRHCGSWSARWSCFWCCPGCSRPPSRPRAPARTAAA